METKIDPRVKTGKMKRAKNTVQSSISLPVTLVTHHAAVPGFWWRSMVVGSGYH